MEQMASHGEGGHIGPQRQLDSVCDEDKANRSSDLAYVYEPVNEGEFRVLHLFPDLFEAPIRCSLECRPLPLESTNPDGDMTRQIVTEFREKLQSDSDLKKLTTTWYTGVASTSEDPVLRRELESHFIEYFKLRRNEIQEAASHAKFEALSYVWGSPENKSTIICSGHKFQVTRSLATALQYLRHTDRIRHVWADAICINQQDLNEKAHQVQQMARVYATAERSLLWLGEESINDEDALLKVPGWIQSHVDAPYINWNELKVEWTMSPLSFSFAESGLTDDEVAWLQYQQVHLPPMLHLFARDWWSRRWIIQELVVAKEATLICGNHSIDWASIQSVLGVKENPLSHAFALITSLHNTDELRRKSQRGMVNAHSLTYFKAHPGELDLPMVALICQGFECTVAVDGVFSILAVARSTELSRESHLLKVDYTARAAIVFTNFTLWMITNMPHNPWMAFNFVLGNRKLFNGREKGDNIDKQDQQTPNSDEQPPTWTCALVQSGLLVHRDAAYPLAGDYDASGWNRGARSDEPVNPIYWIEPSTGSSMLCIQGKLVGTIDEIHPPYPIPSGNKNHFLTLRAWITTIMRLVKLRASDPRSAIQLFHQLTTCGGEKAIALSKPISSKPYSSVEDAERFVASICDTEENQTTLNFDPGERTFIDSLKGAMHRKLCVTSSGLLGWVPSTSELGDQVCVFSGAEVPHVISPCGGGYHNLIGSCYIEGLMFGEVFDLDLQEETINLY